MQPWCLFNSAVLYNFIVGRFRSCKWFSFFLKKNQPLDIYHARLFWLRERKDKLILQTAVLGFTHLSVTCHSQLVLCYQLGHTLSGLPTCSTAHLTTEILWLLEILAYLVLRSLCGEYTHLSWGTRPVHAHSTFFLLTS